MHLACSSKTIAVLCGYNRSELPMTCLTTQKLLPTALPMFLMSNWWVTHNSGLEVQDHNYYRLFPQMIEDQTHDYRAHMYVHRHTHTQGVVTYILAVLIPATGIKVRSSSQAVKLEMIKRSRRPFVLLNQGQDGSCPLTPPTPHPPPVGNQGSRLF